jgi:hypothetical protein
MADNEELIESYRTFVTTLTLSTSVERANCPQARCAKTLRVCFASDRRQKGEKRALGVDEEKAAHPELAPQSALPEYP